ncbi:MAG: hypothetical protein HYS26_03280 [Candidatus Kaiserbacteria bacterium]|nr:MAG: hypothetical protein HYS26_03280 [Candidatus Kaiserbacteria bacterium]
MTEHIANRRYIGRLILEEKLSDLSLAALVTAGSLLALLLGLVYRAAPQGGPFSSEDALLVLLVIVFAIVLFIVLTADYHITKYRVKSGRFADGSDQHECLLLELAKYRLERNLLY